MKIIADLGKLNDGSNLIIIEKGDRIEYVLARGYDPDAREGEQWDSGTYLYSIDSLVDAITDINYGISYTRMREIAEASFDRLDEYDEKDMFIYDNLSYKEKESFGLITDDDISDESQI